MADTITRRFLETAKRHPAKTAVRFPQSRSARNTNWLELNWADYRKLVDSLAAGLQACGVRKGDRVAILANTRLEWAALDLAILGLGAVTVPIYPSSTLDDIAFILHDSQSKLLFVEDLSVFKKMHSVLGRESKLRRPEKVVLIDSAPASDIPSFTDATTLDEMQVLGEKALKASPSLYELAVNEVKNDDVATIIYTSGTTGRPKGVVHTHMQAFSEVSEAFPLLGVSSNDVTLTFLPFAHVLGRIEIWGHALLGFTMGFAVSIDRLKQDFREIRPTIIVAVPRIFEKIHAGILAQADISPLRRKVFDWALETGREISRCKQEKRAIPLDPAKRILELIQPKIEALFPSVLNGGAVPAPTKMPAKPQASTGQGASTPSAAKVYPSLIWETVRPRVLVIGSSTGGPNALEKLFSALRPPYSVPILITQHMPAVFTATFAERLGKLLGAGKTVEEVREGRDGEVLLPNRIYVAPGDYHMTLKAEGESVRIALDQGPPQNFVRPAVDPLFQSAAAIYRSGCMGIVLTGMGADGRIGSVAIKDAGGSVLIQNRESCVVYGMPGAVEAAGAFDLTADLEEIARVVSKKISLESEMGMPKQKLAGS